MRVGLVLGAADWVRSSYSDASGGDCVEFTRTLAATHGVIPVRDSKRPHGPVLVIPAGSWSSFIEAIRTDDHAADCR